MTHLPLAGRTALVTGVSRRRGVGFAVARRLLTDGASVAIQHYQPHDLDQPWGGDDVDALVAELRDAAVGDARFMDVEADLRDGAAPGELVRVAVEALGGLDLLVCNHAKSGNDGAIHDMTAERLSAFWETNTRSTLLLTQAFAALHGGVAGGARPGDAARGAPLPGPVGHVIWMTSGQQDGPMRGEVAYAASKAALAGVTATVAAELLELGIVLNTVNPGPVNTGYLDSDSTDRDLGPLDEWRARTPFGRFGEPADPARLIAWLVSEEGSWVAGQVLKTDGGLSLY
ncbi:SDR family oxidoreductase [Demequina sp. NBRC 110053]|uniref:SDR family oxidoreductase n=1 Tax=Demequina sp. NBRC 110053 TaxID=1570342 RepID=UPI0009FDF30A|nr:SDR family oxidoreductase [Demequina sp. NBRC 110053]